MARGATATQRTSSREDVARCQIDAAAETPEDRTHMHGGVGDVHHPGATWGRFFTNIGWTLGDDFLFPDAGPRLFTTAKARLKFIVNGRAVPSLRNRVIGNVERVVISFGPESVDEVIAAQLPELGTNAQAFNEVHADPGGCTGTGPPPLTTWEKVRRTFLF